MCDMYRPIGDIVKKTSTPRLQGSVSVDIGMEVMDMYEIDIIAIECDDDFAGIFSRGDFNRSVIRHNLNPKETTLYEAMPLNTPSIDAHQTVKETYEAMLAYQWHYMPVVQGRALCGIVSLSELSKSVVKSFEESKTENEIIKAYIQTGESYAMADYGRRDQQ